jgi:hypothetical protein
MLKHALSFKFLQSAAIFYDDLTMWEKASFMTDVTIWKVKLSNGIPTLTSWYIDFH